MPIATLAVLLTTPLAAQSPLYTFHGDSPNDEFGVAVAGAGDVNWDGYDDVIVGAHWDDDKGTDSGSARVFSGIDGSVLTTLYGDAAGDFFGLAVACAGDVNGDLYADVIVGADGSDGNGVDSGMARVFSGKDWSVLYTWYGDNAGDQLGGAVASAGDVDGDGRDDLIVGMRFDDDGGTDSGSARVYSGATGAVLHTFHGDSTGDQFGTSVGGGVDVNGDGTPDIVVGAPFDDNGGTDAGSVRVLSGYFGTVLKTMHGTGAGDRLGTSVDGLGDLNGDGFDEFMAGAPGADSNGVDAGLVLVYSGSTGGLARAWSGVAANDQLGASCRRAGDVNGDLIPDVITGARLNDGTGNNAGVAYVWNGATGHGLHTLYGSNSGDWFGDAVAGAGDVDGDGLDDIVSGARLADVMGPNSGSVEVHAFSGPKNTWYVDAAATPPGLGTQAQPYASIQYAIDQPGTVSGDTVEIAAGVYFEQVDLRTKSLSLVAPGGPSSTTIDGGQVSSVVTLRNLKGGRLVLSGLTIRNGAGSELTLGSGEAVGGGVLVQGASLELHGCILEGNESPQLCGGGAIFLEGPELVVSGSTFEDNASPAACSPGGGAIRAAANSVRIHSAQFLGNESEEGGGAAEIVATTITITDSSFLANTARFGSGGALALHSPLARVERCNFQGNFAYDDGGGAYNTGSVTIDESEFRSNWALNGGGLSGVGAVSNSIFRNNLADDVQISVSGRGGALHGDFAADHCLIVNNRAGGLGTYDAYGGGVYGGSVRSCTVVGNSCNGTLNADGGGLFNAAAVDSIVTLNSPSQLDSSSTASYSDIQGGWPGTGNISADPLFYDPARDDYHLTALSPCIDAGDPMSPKDPDGSRADMGAYWYDPNYCPPTYTYCTAKTNSCGGTPSISATGSPIAGSSSGFVITGTGARDGKAGILMYSSNGEAALPFQGGTLCIAPQGLKRGPAVFATGGTSGSLCDATLSIDWAAFASGAMGGNPPAFLSSPGQGVNVQWWGRDALSVGSYLSDGLEYTVCP